MWKRLSKASGEVVRVASAVRMRAAMVKAMSMVRRAARDLMEGTM